MKTEIKVPSMGESITEATVGALLKASNSKVEVDDEILELETDKVNQVLYAPQAGIVSWNVSSGDVVKIGQVVGVIDSEGASAPSQTAQKSESKPVEPAKTTTPEKVSKPTEVIPAKSTTAQNGNTKLTTAQDGNARLSKTEFLADISSEKTNGYVPKKAAMPPRSAVPSPRADKETRRKMTKIRQVIAGRLVEAQQTAAMLTTFNEIDMTAVMELREKYKEIFMKKHGVKLGFMSFFVKAVMEALMEFPDFNSYIDGDEIVHREYYDIGIAVGTDRGLVVPVVRNCDTLSFQGIESAIEAFAKKARDGSLTIDDLQGGGFTITNGGVYGSLLSTPILNAPQPGILGMHKILKRPVVVNDQIVIRPMMYVALSYDHRLVDGKGAVSFLIRIKDCLEDPARLQLDV